MARPNAFTNELEKWVHQEHVGSIVFVEFRKRDREAVKQLWGRVFPIRAAKEKAKREAILDYEHFCTGFVVRAEEARILIVTCAHVLGDSFSATNPITPKQVEHYFDVLITCDHHEQSRENIRCSVERISIGNDLILLSVPRNVFHDYCSQSHNPLPMAPRYPDPLETVVMLSWPPNMHRTAAVGQTTHVVQPYNNISTNPKGYTCRLAKVNIASEDGSSGGPLINGDGEFLCTLHGGFGSRFSYFVCFEDLRNTLVAWGVLEGGAVAV